jgi:hypothetical protein
MCTQCILKIPKDPKIKCTIGTRGSHCKECIKRKQPDGGDDLEAVPPCIQFDVARYPKCWGVISATRDKLIALGTPAPFPASMDAEIARMTDHCEMLVEFTTVSALDRLKQVKANRASRDEKQGLTDHLDHVRKEVAHLNIEKNRTARQHKNEVDKLRDTIKAKDVRIGELASAIQASASQNEQISKISGNVSRVYKKIKVTDVEAKGCLDID